MAPLAVKEIKIVFFNVIDSGKHSNWPVGLPQLTLVTSLLPVGFLLGVRSRGQTQNFWFNPVFVFESVRCVVAALRIKHLTA